MLFSKTKLDVVSVFFLLSACAEWIPEKLPVPTEIDSNLPPAYIREIEDGLSTWNGVADRPVFVVSVKPLSKGFSKCGKIQISTRKYDTTKKLGWTGLTRCSAIIYLAQDLNLLDIANVIEHEAGHAIGLNHVKNKNSIMYPEYWPGRQVFTKDMLDYVNYW